MRRCDNMQCNNLRCKQEHMRCGGCEKMFYCSEVCQIADCRDGAYKEACARFQTLSLSEPETVGTRDRSFLWAVVHHDHLVEWGMLLLHRVLNILEDKRGGQPEILRFTLLDYTSGDVKDTGAPGYGYCHPPMVARELKTLQQRADSWICWIIGLSGTFLRGKWN
ncbi:hypothetical protein C8J57DRAFT_1259577 [Mycena rebaudengoi]|nr:hypothetical protein C8J57DRAFT_1259577 [Mycena rebaudengoi]